MRFKKIEDEYGNGSYVNDDVTSGSSGICFNI